MWKETDRTSHEDGTDKNTHDRRDEWPDEWDLEEEEIRQMAYNEPLNYLFNYSRFSQHPIVRFIAGYFLVGYIICIIMGLIYFISHYFCQ